ncbi:MAG TPA: Uma2 family endonuclease [Pirellulales bacterium]|nr:Uma2 family endonuclease [Pirellulales bacterium]
MRAPALLASGDRLSQAEFHRRYLQYPDDIKFELIDGTVYLAPPTRLRHGKCASMLGAILGLYEMQTPGVEAALNATLILGPESEPQPDLVLRVLPRYGGRTWTDELFLAGPPELVMEIAYNAVAIDLHDKKDDYERCGVEEYVVVCLEEGRVLWFDLPGRETRKVPADGILCSTMFPGLRIDTESLFRGEMKRPFDVLKEGLSSLEHARFARRLEKATHPRKATRKTRPTLSKRRSG